MKLATYRAGGQDAVGLVEIGTGRVIDLSAAANAFGLETGALASMQSLIEGGEAALDIVREIAERDRRAKHAQPLEAVRLLAPLPVPQQIRDFTVFEKHAIQAPVGMQKLAARLAGQPVPDVESGPLPQVYRDRPIYYITNRFSVAGPEDEVRWPAYSRYMDFELEIAAVIGRGGRDVARADAGDHIFGYTIFNDFSARDTQLAEMAGMLGPAKGKSFDGGNVFGPWIVTRDELGPGPFAMEARVNGETFVRGTSGDMLHGFEDMIAYVSTSETLHPGEIFGSGTTGDGCGLERDCYLEDGAVVELEVQGIGVLRNRVAA